MLVKLFAKERGYFRSLSRSSSALEKEINIGLEKIQKFKSRISSRRPVGQLRSHPKQLSLCGTRMTFLNLEIEILPLPLAAG